MKFLLPRNHELHTQSSWICHPHSLARKVIQKELNLQELLQGKNCTMGIKPTRTIATKVAQKKASCTRAIARKVVHKRNHHLARAHATKMHKGIIIPHLRSCKETF
jgi:hypothetical protein